MRQRVLTVACVVMLVAAAGHVRAGIYLGEHAHTRTTADAGWDFGGLDAGGYSEVDEDREPLYATSSAGPVSGAYVGASASATAGHPFLNSNIIARAGASANALGQNFPVGNQTSSAGATATASWLDEVIWPNPTETTKTVSLKFRWSASTKLVTNLAPAARGEALLSVFLEQELVGQSNLYFLSEYHRYTTGYEFTQDSGGFDTLSIISTSNNEHAFVGEFTRNLLLNNRPRVTGDDSLFGVWGVTLYARAYSEGGESIADGGHTLGLVSIRDAVTGEDLSDVVFLGSGMAVPVPEPSSLAFFGIGALGIVGRRRKRTA